ncbi:MarR family winged helix-turn-helix transcriptional regulator [uncultured Williamsia sp.]|uniref:MarR family winged helix-turn-helix transcriptional regulator n=1 Tax=uncultured Williamsia sp. TaxID=259311 RepID=UPI002630699A|nr:MarR family winged helix-turn-helix transcriptional regulator [uncultured Williamsia sp.]
MFSRGDDLEPQPDVRVVPLRSVENEPDGPLSDADQQAWRSFVEGTQALLTFLDRELVDETDLALGEYMILEALADQPVLRMTDLAGGGLASRSTISRQVSRLVDLGDVERIPDTSDARNRLVRITDAGRDHLRRAANGHAHRVRRHLFAHVWQGHTADLDKFFRDIREGLE